MLKTSTTPAIRTLVRELNSLANEASFAARLSEIESRLAVLDECREAVDARYDDDDLSADGYTLAELAPGVTFSADEIAWFRAPVKVVR